MEWTRAATRCVLSSWNRTTPSLTKNEANSCHGFRSSLKPRLEFLFPWLNRDTKRVPPWKKRRSPECRGVDGDAVPPDAPCREVIPVRADPAALVTVSVVHATRSRSLLSSRGFERPYQVRPPPPSVYLRGVRSLTRLQSFCFGLLLLLLCSGIDRIGWIFSRILRFLRYWWCILVLQQGRDGAGGGDQWAEVLSWEPSAFKYHNFLVGVIQPLLSFMDDGFLAPLLDLLERILRFYRKI